MDTQTHPLLAWKAPARLTHDRSERWYMVAGIFCAVLIAYGVLSGAWTLSLTFALLGGLYYLTRNEQQMDHSIAVYDNGIEYDGKLYIWGDLKEFWILKGATYFELRISFQKSYRHDLVIHTGNVDPFVVRDALGQYIPQIGHQPERILDAIIRFCKL